MTIDRIQGSEPDETLKLLVKKFSMLEGRQPRVMVCRNQEYEADSKINEISVELADLGFDVDIGIPFNSVGKLGMNAIENDVDILVLLAPESELRQSFFLQLKEFFSESGYSDLLVLNQLEHLTPHEFKKELTVWLDQTLP